MKTEPIKGSSFRGNRFKAQHMTAKNRRRLAALIKSEKKKNRRRSLLSERRLAKRPVTLKTTARPQPVRVSGSNPDRQSKLTPKYAPASARATKTSSSLVAELCNDI